LDLAAAIPPSFFQDHNMKAAIKASSVISPQPTYLSGGFPEEIREYVSDRLFCVEPDYKDLIHPLQLRRMPRILKMGLASAQLCINRAGNVSPDAIIVGTGLGCLDNLEKFLLEVLRHNEHVTSVLPFINSTHNAVAAQVAMLLKNHNYNITYCHRGFSFESALQDALMHFEENKVRNILIGGIDECTNDFVKLHDYLDYWKEPTSNLQLFAGNSPGTIAGEGSAFFMLTGEPGADEDAVIVEGCHTFFTPEAPDINEVKKELDEFLKTTGVPLSRIDGVMFGLNGDNQFDSLYYGLQNDYFTHVPAFMGYKHLCGEYYTASAFAFWLGTVILQSGSIPDIVKLTGSTPKPLKNILLYNHFRNTEHSMIFLSYGRL
jgi:3-oxoacyl-[acyl-carrier-protein] synthase II